MTDVEKDQFLAESCWGILCFSGDVPYAVPVGFHVIKGEIFLGFDLAVSRRKMEYVKRSQRVCLNICRPAMLSSRWTESIPFQSMIMEGELQEIAEDDRPKYGLRPAPKGYRIVTYKINVKNVGTQFLDGDV